MALLDIKALIFDLDDTLYPQVEYTRQCLHATAPYISELSGIEVAMINENLSSILDKNGIEYKKIYNDLFDAIGFDGMGHIKEIVEIFRNCDPKIEAYPNVFETLDKLSEEYRLAMITDGYEKVQKYKIEQLKLNDYFENVLITDTLGVENRKPSIVPYEKLLDLMNLNPEDCVYIGNDPRKDFVACKKLGMKTVRIKQGDYKDLVLNQEYEADCSVDDIIELLDLVKLK